MPLCHVLPYGIWIMGEYLSNAKNVWRILEPTSGIGVD